MADGSAFEAPEIADRAIPWACTVLGLPATAFSGADGNDPRLPVLKSLDTLDIEACPGSGKTTLRVAKLAVLAGMWTEQRRGICVLSHTNVARRELETKLGSTAEGQRLLSYPHFIGTIHGFVNEFLAVPWLRSSGYRIEMIDNEVALGRRWRKLSPAIRAGLEKNRHDPNLLKVCDVEFGLGEVRWGKGTLGARTATYQALQTACRECAQEGYFCHDEMFVWAHDLMDKAPEVTAFLRERFQLLFIDEVQDNSDAQSAMLHRVFMGGDGPIIRQRYGDANQAIYQYAGQTEDAATDPFPLEAIRTDIPNSFRFGQGIADLADPLALEPQGLQGKRLDPAPGESHTAGKHAIFLFDDDAVGRVLETYAAYLVEVFSAKELSHGIFTALGAVHRPGADTNIPRSVGHYWRGYDHEIGRVDAQPQSFVQYVSAGNRLSQMSGETHAMVEKIAEAVIRLARIASPNFLPGSRKRKHRYVLELLEGKESERKDYLDLVRALAVDRATLTEDEWRINQRPAVVRVVECITGAAPAGEEVDDFLGWGSAAPAATGEEEQRASDNIFRYPANDPLVSVRVGSIHSAKGETHTATLVLETFYHAHHLKALKPWLTGERVGRGGASAALQSRLKLHYVAMTRPARLLCLAIREDSLEDSDIARLKQRGWRIARVTAAGADWIG